ncbi:MAG: hypothetical protein J5892_04860 [Bacilli bacterium]|nr:hypothetical protein [Bacilli bacterium]
MKRKIILTTIIFIAIIIGYTQIIKKYDYYQKQYLIKTNRKLASGNALRGNIYDVNNKLLVSSITVNNISYHYIKDSDIFEVIDVLANYANFNNVSSKMISDYQQARKIDNLNQLDLQKAYLYYLMNHGSKFDEKIIFKDVTNDFLTEILSLNLPGISSYPSYERYYHYDTCLNMLLGKVGKIRSEDKTDYLNKGYDLNDLVGTSFLEKEYENYLKGTKAVYLINDDYSKTLIKKMQPGNDLYLNIDIDLQMDVEKTLKEEIVNLKKLKNTEYYNTSYVIISDPKSGGIKAIAGLALLNNDFNNPLFDNKTVDILTKSFVVGSVIKGASQSVAYYYDVIKRDQLLKDSCVKLYSLNPKCSFKDLGLINDISALKYSSNYYQFINAIKVSGNTYQYNMKLEVSRDDFLKYRNLFKTYGLGVSSGIDILEYVPTPGSNTAPDLLLNLAIGQYDPYTPISLTSYINTIANGGIRNKLSMVKVVKDGDVTILNNNNVLLNRVPINEDDLKRIQQGFIEVLDHGTGWGYINLSYKPAGKTGTSETFMDSDGDLIDDLKTITQTSAMYFPYDDPKYSIVIVSPNTSHYLGKTDYIAPINSKISKKLTKNMFENY